MNMGSRNYDDLIPQSDSNDVHQIIDRLHSVSASCVDSSFDRKCAVAYSGGIDSSVLAVLVNTSNKSEGCLALTLGTETSADIARLHPPNFITIPWIRRIVDLKNIDTAAKRIGERLNVSSLTHYEDCVAFWLIAEYVSTFGSLTRVLLANGPDEVFCGYDRFRRMIEFNATDEDLAREVGHALQMALELQRHGRAIFACFGIDASQPFLSTAFVDFALKEVPIGYKIRGKDDRLRKRIWRAYGRSIALPEEIVVKKKKAMQYSMGVHTRVLRLLKEHKIAVSH